MLVRAIYCLLVLYVPTEIVTASLTSKRSDTRSEECEFDGEPCPCLPPTKNETSPSFSLIEIITNGTELLKNYTHVEEAVIVVGVTGVGKSTAVQIMAGKLTQLYAVATTGGDLVIIDNEDLIGAGASSKTVFPHLVIKNLTHSPYTISFYDFPGFQDTRGTVFDIAVNYLMTEVTKKIGKAKILFVTTLHAMKRENEGLVKLGNLAVQFVKRFEDFVSSIGLVINKADFWKSNNQVLNDARRHLNDYIYDLGNKTEEGEKQKKITLAQTFLYQDADGNHPNMWFIRTPDLCGSLNESTKMHQAEQGLMNVLDNLQYTQTSEDSFDFSLSPSTKDCIREQYRPNVTQETAGAVSTITLDLSSWYIQTKLRNSSLNISSMADVLHNDIEKLATLIDDIRVSPESLLNLLQGYWTYVGHVFPTEYHDFIEIRVQVLVFLNKALGDRDGLDIITNELDKFKTELADIRDWYYFCSRIEDATHRHAFHKNRPPAPSDPDRVNWITYIKENDITTVSLAEEALASKMCEPEISLLKGLLMFATVTPILTCSSSLRNLTLIQGNFITIEEIIQVVKGTCRGNIYELHIYAAHTIFLDAKLNKSDINYQLVMMAPYWISNEGTQWQLLLNGESAPPHDNSKATDGKDATERSSATAGAHGCAGKAGASGGYVFGAALDIQSLQGIYINADGGNGGNGQAGGTGGKGFGRDSIWCFTDANYDKPTCWHDVTVHCKHPGRSGSNGANGGNGGKAGPGGYAGEINIKIDSGVQINQSALAGSKGEDGSAGNGRNGGPVGKGYTCDVITCNSIPPENKTAGKNGVRGVDGASNSCKTEAVRREKSIDEFEAISRFKTIFSSSTHRATIAFVSFLDSI